MYETLQIIFKWIVFENTLLRSESMSQFSDITGGVALQHKCLRTMFTTFFVLLTSVFGTLALEERAYHWEWMFSLCNMMQGKRFLINKNGEDVYLNIL